MDIVSTASIELNKEESCTNQISIKLHFLEKQIKSSNQEIIFEGSLSKNLNKNSQQSTNFSSSLNRLKILDQDIKCATLQRHSDIINQVKSNVKVNLTNLNSQNCQNQLKYNIQSMDTQKKCRVLESLYHTKKALKRAQTRRLSSKNKIYESLMQVMKFLVKQLITNNNIKGDKPSKTIKTGQKLLSLCDKQCHKKISQKLDQCNNALQSQLNQTTLPMLFKYSSFSLCHKIIRELESLKCCQNIMIYPPEEYQKYLSQINLSYSIDPKNFKQQVKDQKKCCCKCWIECSSNFFSNCFTLCYNFWTCACCTCCLSNKIQSQMQQQQQQQVSGTSNLKMQKVQKKPQSQKQRKKNLKVGNIMQRQRSQHNKSSNSQRDKNSNDSQMKSVHFDRNFDQVQESQPQHMNSNIEPKSQMQMIPKHRNKKKWVQQDYE